MNVVNIANDAYAHCQALVRASDRDRFVATLFAPSDRRPYLFALYAFNLEISRISEVAHEPLPGEIRLQWWRDALTGAGEGGASGHPVVSALLGTIESCQFPVEPLLDLIEARGFDLYQDPMRTSVDLDLYVRRTLLRTVCHCGADHRRRRTRDSRCGRRRRSCIWNSDAPEHCPPARIARSRLRAVRHLDRHGASAHDLLTGHSTPALEAALAEVGSHASRHFNTFLEQAQRLPTSARAAFLPVAIVPPLLRRLRKRRGVALSVVEISPLSRLITLARSGWPGFPAP